MKTALDNHPNGPGSRQVLIDAIEARIAREKLTRTGFGRDAVDDGSFLGRLDRGSDVSLETADKVLAFLGKEPTGLRSRGGLRRFRPMRQERRRRRWKATFVTLRRRRRLRCWV